MMQVVPGSQRYYCRVDDCSEWTWANVPYGYCATNLREHLDGQTHAEKSYPPVGTTPEKVGVVTSESH